eukprot:gnl/MRDRNA2_/MRDRNA2_154538_c0_seq1.p1 gnl/MRDRNA2_/MRDRNA2_154538_c0~~gnl/MRDRNA2_/MRDRNA2_154538_c0_seq1.p1  ORF type:complete len:732 (-),score=110.58 gnl/MRDRNA2_/MRDRNA2_154538_c0_seq1:58-2253(-)
MATPGSSHGSPADRKKAEVAPSITQPSGHGSLADKKKAEVTPSTPSSGSRPLTSRSLGPTPTSRSFGPQSSTSAKAKAKPKRAAASAPLKEGTGRSKASRGLTRGKKKEPQTEGSKTGSFQLAPLFYRKSQDYSESATENSSNENEAPAPLQNRASKASLASASSQGRMDRIFSRWRTKPAEKSRESIKSRGSAQDPVISNFSLFSRGKKKGTTPSGGSGDSIGATGPGTLTALVSKQRKTLFGGIRQTPETPVTDFEILHALSNCKRELEIIFKLSADENDSMQTSSLFNAMRRVDLTLRPEGLSLLTQLLVGGRSEESITLRHLEATIEPGAKQYFRRVQLVHFLRSVSVFSVFLLPSIVIVLSLIFGGILHVLEGWSFLDCFFLVLMELSGTHNFHLHSLDPSEVVPRSIGGKVVCLFVGILSVVVLGSVLFVMAGPLAAPCITCLGVGLQSDCNSSQHARFRKSVFLVFIVYPVIAAIISCIFGGIVAGMEGVPLEDAIFACLSLFSACGISVANMRSLRPQTGLGRVFCAMLGLWATILFGAVAGALVGAVVEPMLSAVGCKPVESRLAAQVENSTTMLHEPASSSAGVGSQVASSECVRSAASVEMVHAESGVPQSTSSLSQSASSAASSPALPTATQNSVAESKAVASSSVEVESFRMRGLLKKKKHDYEKSNWFPSRKPGISKKELFAPTGTARRDYFPDAPDPVDPKKSAGLGKSVQNPSTE